MFSNYDKVLQADGFYNTTTKRIMIETCEMTHFAYL